MKHYIYSNLYTLMSYFIKNIQSCYNKTNIIEVKSFLLQKTVIESIKKQIKSGSGYIFIPPKTNFTLTKGDMGKSHGFLIRDKVLENEVHKDISTFGLKKILNRYKKFDPKLKFDKWPEHYPIKVHLMNGVINNGENIFMIFPSALGIHSNKAENYFSFEFIDVWEKIFLNIIFPCVERIFTSNIYAKIKELFGIRILYTTYITSLFHEFGHYVGPWRIFPNKDKNIKIKKFQSDILGELSTDSLLGETLFDFNEIGLCVLLQRLFWYGRMGFNIDNLQANVNKDSDCWIGSYLWNKFRDSNCIFSTKRGWEINIEYISTTFKSINDEINTLSNELKSADKKEHIAIVNKWMQQHMKHDIKLGYLLPDEFREVLFECNNIPYNAIKSNLY